MLQRISIFISVLFFFACSSGNKKQGHLAKADTARPTSKSKPDSAKPIVLTKAQKDSAYADSIIQDKISDTLFALPEIKRFAQQIDSESHDTTHAELLFDPPTPEAPYYWVHVGFSDPYMYHTLYHFHVIIKGKAIKEIKFYDVVNDTDISLATWRKNLKVKGN